jgi:hypothetical protein
MTLWVHPKVKDTLESKYRGRLIATTDVLLSSLADGNVLIMSGEDVAKLHKRGLKNGAQILSALDASDNTERENQQLRTRLEQFDALLKQAGVT